MKRMVRRAERPRASRAALIAARTSAVPELTAESCSSRAPVSPAIARASVVLPDPGGPQKIIENSSPRCTAARKTVPGPTISCWPTNPSSDRGRMRAASGASAASCSSDGLNRLSIRTVYPPRLARRPPTTRGVLLR